MSSNKHIVWILPGFASSESDDTCLPMMLDLLEYIQKNKEIRIYEVSDFLTNTEKEIGRTKIDSFGRFSFTIQTPEIKKIILRFDDKAKNILFIQGGK